MRFTALLLLAALAGALVCAREYGPPTAPTKALTVQGSLSSCLYSSFSPNAVLASLPSASDSCPPPPPNSPHVAYLPHWCGEGGRKPLAISSHILLYPL